MKNLDKHLILLQILYILTACADSAKSVSHRGQSQKVLDASFKADSSAPSNNDISSDPGSAPDSTLDFVGPNLREAKNNAALTPEFKANILLMSKISATQLVIFDKNGRSWLYNPGDALAPAAQEAAVVKPVGYSLLTLPEGRFWLIGPNALGRRKAGDAASDEVLVENFDTKEIKGDWSKLRILFAANDQIVLHLDTMIAILSVKDGKPALSQFSSKLPVSLDGEIIAAGETEAGGYWFAAKESFAILELKELKWVWSKIKVPLTGHEDYKTIALRLDSSKKEVNGDAMLLQSDKIWSVSGAAIQ